MDVAEEYTKGETAKEFQERLWRYCSGVVNATRGIHLCNLCAESAQRASVLRQSRLGSAELRVFYADKVYASPNLIYHYVVEHGYKPPQEFVEAVLHGLLPASPQYIKISTQRGNDSFYFDFVETDED